MANESEVGVIWRLMTTNYSYITKPQQGETIQAAADRMSGLFDIWVQLLADIPAEVLRVSALQHISESKWFPSVSDLRDAAYRILYPLRQTAIEAWGEVQRQFGTVGYYGVPRFSDDTTAGVVAELGWRNLCTSECQEADRARFLQGYDEHIKRKKSDAIALPEVTRVIRELAANRNMQQLGDGKHETQIQQTHLPAAAPLPWQPGWAGGTATSPDA